MNSKKSGFSLVSLLVIIGIAAGIIAMYPMFVANNNSKAFPSKFEEKLANLSQVAKSTQSQYDSDFGTLTQACNVENGASVDSLDRGQDSFCALFNKGLSGATFISDFSKLSFDGKPYAPTGSGILSNSGANIALSNYYGYQLSDGAIVAFPKLSPSSKCTLYRGGSLDSALNNYVFVQRCIGFIDLNGVKEPNKEALCGTGNSVLPAQRKTTACQMSKDATHVTDIYPIAFHDAVAEPASDAGYAVIKSLAEKSSM